MRRLKRLYFIPVLISLLVAVLLIWKLDIQSWARYDFTAWDNSSVANIASIVSSAFGGASAGTGGESASTALSNALADPVASGLFTGNTSGEPEAYLQYVFFDENHNYVANGFRLCSSRSRCRR